MTETIAKAQLAFLATGDELVSGDVINTNSAAMAQVLLERNIVSGMQCVVADDIEKIKQTLAFLLSHYAIVILTGGLGPTSDDLTRFAVAAFLELELSFHEPSWQRIVERLKSRAIPVTDNNRQQCLFPEGAQILENTRGTADGCVITVGRKRLVMLPGPPRECLSLFQDQVLPLLLQRNLAVSRYQHRWLLMAIGEGHAAEMLQPLIPSYAVEVGYRVCSPYLELKLIAQSKPAIENLIVAFEQRFHAYIVSDSNKTASALLNAWLAQHPTRIYIEDAVTAGALQSILSLPTHQATVDFTRQDVSYDYHFEVAGLEQYWSNQDSLMDSITVSCHFPYQDAVEKTVHLLGLRTIEWVKEYCCWQLLQWLQRVWC